MAPFLTSAVAAPIGGWLSDRLCARYGKRVGRSRVACCAMSIAGVRVFFGAIATNPKIAVLLLSVSIGTLFLCAYSFWATTIDLARTYAGTASGLMNMGGNLGGTISPSFTPYLAQNYDWEIALFVMSGLSFVGALRWLGINPQREIEFSS